MQCTLSFAIERALSSTQPQLNLFIITSEIYKSMGIKMIKAIWTILMIYFKVICSFILLPDAYTCTIHIYKVYRRVRKVCRCKMVNFKLESCFTRYDKDHKMYKGYHEVNSFVFVCWWPFDVNIPLANLVSAQLSFFHYRIKLPRLRING